MTLNNETTTLDGRLAADYMDAIYADHPNPEYHGNPLIAALPFYLSDDELVDGLEELPNFSEAQRAHISTVRLTYIGRLSRCVVALPRTTALARALLDLMLEGYVGREPFLPEHRLKKQRLYELMKRRAPISEMPDPAPRKTRMSRDSGAELSTAFIGASGCGKTTTMKQIAKLLPPVIRHDDMWQVPVLIFELPPDGRSLHGLATAIIDALDRRLPHAGYADLFLRNVNRKNAFERIYQAAKLLHIHGVGLLIADESQKQKPSEEELRRKPSGKDAKHKQLNTEHDTPLIALLITASNKLGVPLVLVGTNELHDVLDGRFSKRRRGTGHGTEYWTFLKRSGNVREPDEFEALLRKLWRFQWVQNPLKLNNERADLFFELTQGNPDIMVKLFASSQRRAILEGVEELTDELIRETYRNEFRMVHEPLHAHAEQDPEKLVQYVDIAPVELRSGPGFAAVAAEMNQSNYERKREQRAQAAARRRAEDLEPPTAAELSATPSKVVKLTDALEGGNTEGGTPHQRLAAAGALASKHDAI